MATSKPEPVPAESQLTSLETQFITMVENFDDRSQEWRRLFSELLGTFFLVLVAAGGGMMGQAFPDTISRTAAVTAPALMVLGVILFMGKMSGAHLNPAVSIAFALRGDFPWAGCPANHRAIDRRDAGCLVPAGRDRGVRAVRVQLSGPGIPLLPGLRDGDGADFGLVSVILGTASGAQNVGVVGALGVGGYIALADLWASPRSVRGPTFRRAGGWRWSCRCGTTLPRVAG